MNYGSKVGLNLVSQIQPLYSVDRPRKIQVSQYLSHDRILIMIALASQGSCMVLVIRSRRWLVSLLLRFGILLLGITVTACERGPREILSGLDPTPATTVTALLQVKEGESVVVAGRVGTIAPLLGKVAYEVEDATGVVWVLSDRRPPRPNTAVKVYGLLRSSNGERYVHQR
jgi:hypothetical protein